MLGEALFALPPSLARWWMYQLFYLAVAITVQGTLWAVGQKADYLAVLLFVFFLGNLNTVFIDVLRLRLSSLRPLHDWLFFALGELVCLPLFFLMATALGFVLLGSSHMTPPFWRYVATGWRMPNFMALVFGVGYNFFRRASEKMELRNRELQRVVEKEFAGRELQERDLERAREIQQALLPKDILQIAGFELVAAWQPAREVGGDYYDVIPLSPAQLGICIADVVGKGVSAALLMANVQATVRAYASGPADPAWLCRRVNEILCSNLASDKFVTLFYGILDANGRTFHYTNAGHQPPLLARADGTHRRLEEGGAVLGVFRDWNYGDGVVALSPGDRILLFTDGITEATREDGEEFGEAGVLKTTQASRNLPAGELKERLLAEVNTFCKGCFQDDATLLVITALDAARASTVALNESDVVVNPALS